MIAERDAPDAADLRDVDQPVGRGGLAAGARGQLRQEPLDERGAQPVPPEDQIMADIVDLIETIRHVSWADAQRSGKMHRLDDSMHQGYIDLCCRQSLIPPPKFDEIRVVYSPLHGVGSMTTWSVPVSGGRLPLPASV